MREGSAIKLQPPAMLALKTLITIWVALMQTYHLQAQITYTLENANKYIADNKAQVNQLYRQKYHFMPEIGWINDPNGFIYFKDEYHLFYQLNPYDSVTNKIHWGHAKSKDLLNWEHLPVALAPDKSYDTDGVFSGSAIVKDGKLYLMYTGFKNATADRQVQCIATSEDGIVFTKIAENPVLSDKDLPANAVRGEFRDPKVFLRDGKYYAVLASQTKDIYNNTYGQILLYESSDLIKWTNKSTLLSGSYDTGNMWECPDLFELGGKDVLLMSPIDMESSGDNYRNYDSVIQVIGKVNWTTGVMAPEYYNSKEYYRELDHGMDFYAIQTLRDSSGRRIAIAWMNMWNRSYPAHLLGHKWTGAMTIPRELQLKGDNRIVQTPAADFASYFNHTVEYNWTVLDNELKQFDNVSGTVGMLDLIIYMEMDDYDSIFVIELLQSDSEKTTVNYQYRTVTLNRFASGILVTGVEVPPVYSRTVAVPISSPYKLKLKILLDVSSVEVFINDGDETMTATVYPTQTTGNISFSARGRAVIETLKFSYNTYTTSNSSNIRISIICLIVTILTLFQILA